MAARPFRVFASVSMFCVLLLVAMGEGCAGPPSEPEILADLILTGGVIWTADADRSVVEAVAIRGNRISALGSAAEIERLRGSSTRVIELDGAFVTPAFSDNHVHFASAASFLEFNIMASSSQEEFVERVQDVVSRIPEGDWIVGGLWGAYDQWQRGADTDGSAREPFTPDLGLVESLTGSRPMFLRKFDGSEFAVNRAALEVAGLDPGHPPAGVEPVLDSAGEFTGILRGSGVAPFFEAVVPPASHERRLAQTRNALAEIRRRGVSNVSDMSDDEQLEIYRELRERGELTARIHFRYPLDRWSELADRDIRVGSGDEWIRLGGLKGHIDGIMGNSTARFFEAYDHDPSSRGRWRRLMVDDEGDFVEGQFLNYMLDADAAGLQLSVHAIGDEANRLLLDYLEELERQNGPRDRRFRLVHAQVIEETDFARLGELGVIAEVQPFHLSDDMRWMEERIGHERCRGAYAFESIRDSGAMLSFGSDWPGTAAAEYPIDPLLGIYAAVSRQTVTGTPAKGWFPEQRMSVEDALFAYTWGSSYANFEEQEKGSLEPEKLADLTVLSRNLLEVAPPQILDTEVLYTIVDGQIVYESSS